MAASTSPQSTVSTQFPLEGPGYRQNLSGGEDIIVGMMDMTKSNTASLIYSSYLGGSDIDEVRKIALDANNNVILTGFTLSNDFPVTSDAVQRNPQGQHRCVCHRGQPQQPSGVSWSTPRISAGRRAKWLTM